MSWNVLVPCVGAGVWDGGAWGLWRQKAGWLPGPWCPCDGLRVGGSGGQWGPPHGCRPLLWPRKALGGQCPHPAHSWREQESGAGA